MNDNCWLKDECNHVDCNKVCLRYYKLNYLYEEAGVSLSQRKHLTLLLDKSEYDRDAFISLSDISKNIVNFVNDGQQLYIHSSIAGNGKTSWALRLIQEYFNQIWAGSELCCKGLFISVPRLLLALKDNITLQSEYVAHVKANVLTADLVIWDDVATKATITPFESDHLLSYIDNRINLGKSNIFTSNLNDEELHQSLGDRLASRICNYSKNIEFKGADKRGLTYERH